MADSAIDGDTGCTLKVARFLTSTSVRMARVWTKGIEIECRCICGATQEDFLEYCQFHRNMGWEKLTSSRRSILGESRDVRGDHNGEPVSLFSKLSFLLNRSDSFLTPPFLSVPILSRSDVEFAVMGEMLLMDE